VRAAVVAGLCASLVACTRTLGRDPPNFSPPADVVPAVVPLVVDAQFDSVARSKIEEAIDHWNYALHGYRVLYFAGVTPIPLAAKIPENAWTISFAEHAPPPPEVADGAIAWVAALGSGNIHLTPHGYRVGVIIHEIGHSLGLRHLPGTVMAPAGNGQNCIDGETLDSLADVTGWDRRKLRSTCP
jgi:hypothetical protein